jgi:pyridoxamine 5'-phosphate oxidase
MNRDLAAMRRNYAKDPLSEKKAGDCPFQLFNQWLADAMESETLDPNAMTLATVDDQGQPKARTLLLKGFSKEKGWVFYTNYESDKGKELAENPQCSLLFWWENLERQVRIEGRVQKLPEKDSDAYYASRPRDSQIGAWVSEQSQIITSRDLLEERLAVLEEQYAGIDTLPRPPHWGGYQLLPTSVEFWQGQPSRLHDRLRFRLENDLWIKERLAP